MRRSVPARGIRSRPAVLIADDEPNNRLLLSAVLADADCDVFAFEDGLSLLAAAAAEVPAAILLDVNMPGPDGLEVCRRLKSDPRLRLVPVLMVTALGDLEDRVRALDAGADDFLAKPFSSAEVLARVRSFLRLSEVLRALDHTEQVVRSLARAVEARDAYTEHHTERVAAFAIQLGRVAGLAADQIPALWMAASIHDIGKVGVPDAVLGKPGPLTEAERAVMGRHVLIGAEIAAPLRSSDLLVPVIRHHHERWDGRGYPWGLSGQEIPIEARIVAVSDSYDAITSNRPYRRARSSREAIQVLLSGAGTQWDPDLVQLFIDIVYPTALEA